MERSRSSGIVIIDKCKQFACIIAYGISYGDDYNPIRNLTNEHKSGDHKSDTNNHRQSLQKIDSVPNMKKNLSHKSIRAHFDLEYNDELPPAYPTEVNDSICKHKIYIKSWTEIICFFQQFLPLLSL